MFWRIIGIGALAWGIIVFFILSTTPLPSQSSQMPVSTSAEFTIYVLSLGWLVSSSLVKVGLILKKRWVRVSIVASVFFIFLLINMGVVQAQMGGDIPKPEGAPGYPYNLIASWFISWFWVDTLIIMTAIMEWIRQKQLSG